MLLAAVLIQPFAPFDALSRDPLVYAAQAGECCKMYYGALSNLGVMLWTFAGAACVVAASAFWLLHVNGKADASAYRYAAMYYGAAGSISIMFAIDDMFLAHDVVAPHFGVPEEAVLSLYALIAALFVLRFFRRILSFSPLFFVCAVALLAASMSIDVANDLFGLGATYEVEDGLKFLGVAAWTAYFVRSSFRSLALAPIFSQATSFRS